MWIFTNFEETADGTPIHATLEAAQRGAVTDYEAGDTGPGSPGAVYEWRTFDDQPDHYVLFEDGAFTGYWVQPIDADGGKLGSGTEAAAWPHNHYEPWHIVTVTDEPTAGLRVDVKHPEDCDPDGDDCSAAYHVEHFGLDGEKGTPTIGTYRVRYWWDHYKPDGDGLEVETCAPGDYHPDCGQRVADCDCRTVAVLGNVQAERVRQIAKFGEQHREDGTDPRTYRPIAGRARQNRQDAEERGGATWHQVLDGPFFESVSETDPAALRRALIELAAVACAWVEDIDSRTAGA